MSFEKSVHVSSRDATEAEKTVVDAAKTGWEAPKVAAAEPATKAPERTEAIGPVKAALTKFTGLKTGMIAAVAVLVVVVAGYLSFNKPISSPLDAPSLSNPALADPSASRKPFKDCSNCPMMVVVPAEPSGFNMGTDVAPYAVEEGPRHRVTIKKPFAVAIHPVTFDEWDACVSAGACYLSDDMGYKRGRKPAINISWEDAKKYIGWLSTESKHKYRLLSEAEREYVTRAGSSGNYWWGDDISSDQANYGVGVEKKAIGQTAIVGTYKANSFGLFDMHGNVREWVEDCWHGNYKGNPPLDGTAWTDSCEGNEKVRRGGSWYTNAVELRASARTHAPSDVRGIGDIGFRVARDL